MFLNVFTDGTLDFTPRQYAGIGILLLVALVAQSFYLLGATVYIRGHTVKRRRDFWRKERQRLDRVIFGLFIALAFTFGAPFLDFEQDVEDAIGIGARLLGAVCGALLLLRGIAIVQAIADKLIFTTKRDRQNTAISSRIDINQHVFRFRRRCEFLLMFFETCRPCDYGT